jgi:probable F420-dependent oxidoreductase
VDTVSKIWNYFQQVRGGSSHKRFESTTMLFDAIYDGKLKTLASWARRVEESERFSGVWLSDTTNDPFLLSQIVAHSTERLHFGTNIAVAFARSPFCVAQTCANLAALSEGRFTLGLGTQVRAHITKRFNARWPESPVDALCEYVQLLRHLFDKFQRGERPSFKGEYFSCTLNSPVFTPDRHEFGPPKVGFSAVGPRITEAAGRLADAVFLHPFTHRKFLEEVTLPALERGAESRQEGLDRLKLVGSCFILANDAPDYEKYRAIVLGRLAFYASTPNYKKVLASLNLAELHEDLHQLSRQGAWEKMSQILPREMIEACVVVAPANQLMDAVKDRFGDVYDRVSIEPSQLLA